MRAPVTEKIQALFLEHHLDPKDSPLLVTALMSFVYDFANAQVEQALADRPLFRLCTSFDTSEDTGDTTRHDAA